jgi:hypothetical protein
MFVQIDWPDGSALKGQVHVAKNSLVTLKFGPEGEDARWMVLGFQNELHPFVLRGTITVIQSQTPLW